MVGQKRAAWLHHRSAWLLAGVTRATTRWTRVLPRNRAINGLTGGLTGCILSSVALGAFGQICFRPSNCAAFGELGASCHGLGRGLERGGFSTR